MKISKSLIAIALVIIMSAINPPLASQPYFPGPIEDQGYPPAFFDGRPYPDHEYVPPAGCAYADGFYAPKLLATIIIGTAAVVGIAYALTHTPHGGHGHSSGSRSGSGH